MDHTLRLSSRFLFYFFNFFQYFYRYLFFLPIFRPFFIPVALANEPYSFCIDELMIMLFLFVSFSSLCILGELLWLRHTFRFVLIVNATDAVENSS